MNHKLIFQQIIKERRLFLLNKIKKIMSVLSKKDDIHEVKKLSSQILVRDNKRNRYGNIQDTEFKVFSQWGEDGIIQYLIHKLPIENKVFIEFGVEDYTEANTRFLLENDNWSGLVMDGSVKNIESIKKSPTYWKYDLIAQNIFITKDNINEVIESYIKMSSFEKEIGLLSIDIDGNDYHIWDAINAIDPIIVVCEYNSIFGNKHSVTVPYDEKFIRTEKHYSNLYFGASIKALCTLAKSKGYEFIGTNKNFVNAFFVKSKYAEEYISELITTSEKYFHGPKLKQSRDEDGNLSFLRGSQNIEVIKSMEVMNLENGKLMTLENLFYN